MTKFKQSTTKQRPIGNIACKENNTGNNNTNRDCDDDDTETRKKSAQPQRPNSNYSTFLCASDSHFIVKYL